MKRFLSLTCLFLLTISTMSSLAQAQTGPGYDRRATFLEFPPNAAGNSSCAIVFEVLATNGVALGDNASTEAELLVNGTPVALKTWSVVGDGPGSDSCSLDCGGNDCGGMYVDGVFNTMTCHDIGRDCACGHWFTWDPGYEPTPGDEIMVLLRPAPGALPDPDPSNDVLMRIYDGTPSGWNRTLEWVQMEDNGDGTATISRHDHLTVSNIGASGDDGVDMSYQVVVVDDSQAVLHTDTLTLNFEKILSTKNGCTVGCPSTSCGTFDNLNFNLGNATCTPHIGWNNNCGCGGGATLILPNVPLPPGGGGVTVKLIPLPGALPELPGFPEEDDERRPEEPTPVGSLGPSLVRLTNHPNPFNPSTTLRFHLPRSTTDAELTVYDTRGQRVRTLHRGTLTAGPQEFVWDGTSDQGQIVASGVYTSQLRFGRETVRRRLALIK